MKVDIVQEKISKKLQTGNIEVLMVSVFCTSGKIFKNWKEISEILEKDLNNEFKIRIISVVGKNSNPRELNSMNTVKYIFSVYHITEDSISFVAEQKIKTAILKFFEGIPDE